MFDSFLITNQVEPSEVKRLMEAYKNPAELYKDGIRVGGVRYVFLRQNGDNALYGRKGSDAGVCICKTNQALIIGVYEGGLQPGSCNSVVEKLGDYLREKDF